jgi:capsular polysaccharide biosynthesis protein
VTDRNFEPAIDRLGGDETAGLPEFLKDPIQIVRRRWPWMLVAIVLGFAATLAVSLSVKPRYLASATLVVSSQQIPKDFVRPTVRDDSLQRVNALVGTILSKDKLQELILKFDLYAEIREETPMVEIIERVRRDVTVRTIPGLVGRNQSAFR